MSLAAGYRFAAVAQYAFGCVDGTGPHVANLPNTRVTAWFLHALPHDTIRIR
ncbi:MAG: hypothetical protein AB8B97_01515 [Granulosicoccus sp.]